MFFRPVLMAFGLIAFVAQASEPPLRPELMRPLQFAQDHIKKGRFKEALRKVAETDTIQPKGNLEMLLIERMRVAAAVGAGDMDTLLHSFAGLDSSTLVPAPEKLRMVESIATLYYRAQNYARAVPWFRRYFKDGGTDATQRSLMIQALHLSGDWTSTAREVLADIQAQEKAGTKPDEDRINLLVHAAAQQKDAALETLARERLVTHHPKKEHWVTLLSRLQAQPGFADHLALDAYRLSLATGSLDDAQDYMEMAQLAFQAGLGAEAQKVMQQGYAAGLLGVGDQAGRHQRLRDLINQRLLEAQKSKIDTEKQALAAADGNQLLTLGLNKVFEGQAAQGLVWMTQGVNKGHLQRPEVAKLHLGVAQFLAGDALQAQATLKTVSGVDGTRDLARLWLLHTGHGK
jgi:hypothetical protein